jgi:glycosyltransferase involved in cell wall biosynthesis
MLFVRDFLADRQVKRLPDAPAAPAVSVILPTYQRRASGLLQRALDSVLRQSFADLELIVVDDGSVDGTRELVDALQREDSRVVHVRHDLNCGLPALRVNEGIELARGRFIAFQFDDDEWLPEGLAALVEAAGKAPQPSVVFGRAEWIADSWRTELPRVEVDLPALVRQNEIANNSVLVARRLFELHGLYDPHVGMRRLCDWDLWLRLIAHAPFVPVDRLVSRVPFVSDPTAIGVTAPLDLPVVRYLLSIPRNEVLSLGRWHDDEVDALCVAGVDIPRVLAERLEREQLVPFRARHRAAFPHREDGPGEPASSPRVLLCAGDDYRAALDLGLAPDDASFYRRTGIKRVYHPVWELGSETRHALAIDLLLLAKTASPTATGIVSQVMAEGIPAAYSLDVDLLNLPEQTLGARLEIERQLAAVDAVWSTSPAVSESVRPFNPRIVPVAQTHLDEAAYRATELHAATRNQRIEGRPRILYLFASGLPEALDRELLWAAELARDYGFAPHALCAGDAVELQGQLSEHGIPWEALAPQLLGSVATSGLDVGPLRTLIEAAEPACAHASASIAEAEAVCAELGVPLVVTSQEWRSAPAEAPARASELLALYANAVKTTPARAPFAETAAQAAAPAPESMPPPSPRDRVRQMTMRLGVYRPLSRLYWGARRVVAALVAKRPPLAKRSD